jgi:hypothetical protein
MESEVRGLRIETYKAQLAVCNQVRAALSKELENPNLAHGQRIAIGLRRDAALNESYALQLMLDLMERPDREAKTSPCPPPLSSF